MTSWFGRLHVRGWSTKAFVDDINIRKKKFVNDTNDLKTFAFFGDFKDVRSEMDRNIKPRFSIIIVFGVCITSQLIAIRHEWSSNANYRKFWVKIHFAGGFQWREIFWCETFFCEIRQWPQFEVTKITQKFKTVVDIRGNLHSFVITQRSKQVRSCSFKSFNYHHSSSVWQKIFMVNLTKLTKLVLVTTDESAQLKPQVIYFFACSKSRQNNFKFKEMSLYFAVEWPKNKNKPESPQGRDSKLTSNILESSQRFVIFTRSSTHLRRFLWHFHYAVLLPLMHTTRKPKVEPFFT